MITGSATTVSEATTVSGIFSISIFPLLVEINNNPPLSAYLFAVCLKLSSGREATMRFLLLPLDFIAAISLYGLATFFLRRPFWPTLAVVVSPAYAINMAHLMAEKPLVALTFSALYAHVRGIKAKDSRWY